MAKDELSEAIKNAIHNQIEKSYTDADAEKIRQEAAKIFERYEADMADKMSEQMKDYIHEHYLYS